MRLHTLTRPLVVFAAVLLLAGQGCIQITGTKGGANDGGVLRSDDAGQTWKQKSAVASVSGARTFGGLNVTTLALDPSDPRAVYAGTADQGLFYSYDGGESWQGAGSLGRVRPTSIAVSPANKCAVFVGVSNRIMRTLDCARTWESVFFDPRAETRVTSVKVDHMNPAVLYAATNMGDLLKSGDSGSSWSPLHRFENEIRQVLMSASDSRVLYVATRRNGLWKTADGGSSWTELTDGLGEYAGSVDQMILAEAVSRPGTLVLASNYGLLRSDDGGASWKPIPLLTPPGSTAIYSLAVSPKDPNLILYGTATTLYRTVDGGAKWKTAKPPTARTATTLLMDPAGQTIYMGTALLEQNTSPF